jgi:hypothetical protein
MNFIIWKDNLVAFTVKAFDFDEFKCGGQHEKQGVASCFRQEGGMKKNRMTDI